MKETKRPDLSRKRLQQIPLSKECMQVILGGLLGDGHLSRTKGYKNARFQMRHSICQQDYFDWKIKKLQEICTKKSVQVQQPDGWSSQKKLHFMSKACIQCTDIFNVTHSKKKLHIQRHWLNHLEPLGLAVWWFDDGSIISKGQQGILCTDGFDKKYVEILQQYLQVVWHVKTTLRKSGPTFRLALSKTQLQAFLHIISAYIPCKNMIYKMKIQYKNADSLQRWISHLQQLHPSWHQEFAILYDEKMI